MFDYVKPASLTNLINDLAAVKSDGALLAGGTDLIVKMRSGLINKKVLFDINDLQEVNGILEDGDCLRIGAAARMEEIVESDVVRSTVPFLSLAAGEVGSPQIRNRATLGGNILTASPAADTIPPLMAMGAKLSLQSLEGDRKVSIEEFIKGPGHTGIRDHEVLTEIMVSKLGDGCRSHFLKVGRRRALAISVINLAGWIKTGQNGVIEDVRVALGAVAPTPIRAREAEAFLKGKPPTHMVIQEAARLAAGECRPISDIRGTEQGRMLLVEAWTFRLLEILTN